MTTTLLLALAVPVQAVATPAEAVALPDGVRAVIEEAIKSGDAAAVAAVVRFTAAAHPQSSVEITALHQGFLDGQATRARAQADARRTQLAEASPLDNWEGKAELGAVRGTGSSDYFGLFASLSGKREGIDWSHRLEGRFEIQESEGVRTAERASASWQPRRRFDDRLYAYGLAQYERDPFVGIEGRYTGAIGAGYRLIGERNLRVEVEGGPAYRRTDALNRDSLESIAARASLDLTWRIAERVQFKQTGTLFLERENGNGQATTSLDTRLLGPLSMRLSYEVRYQEDVLRGVDTLDTTSRATLVIGF